MRRRSERGSTVPLIVALVGVLLLLVGAVVDSGAAYLGRQELDALADGAALHGADAAAQGDDTYRNGVGRGPLALTEAAARRGALAYLRDVGAFRTHPGLRAAVHLDGHRVVVALTAPVRLPLHLPRRPICPEIGSTGSAEVVPDDPRVS